MNVHLAKLIVVTRYLWLLLPVILMLALTIAMELLVSELNSIWLKSIVASAFGVVGFVIIIMAVSRIAARLQIPPPVIAGWRSAATGLAVGLLLSITCGLVFYCTHGESTTTSIFTTIQPWSFLRNLGPAFIEEASMRAGVVHLLNGMHGAWAGLAGGSIPFGLLHIFGRLFGNPVGISLVIGTTASGLLLSILYLRFGFWAAFSCHWIWNSLARAWVVYAGITAQDGIQQFEGATATIILLIVACLCLFAIGDKRWRQPQSED
jgi:membrane protease YdiL (CAAX protease family)